MARGRRIGVWVTAAATTAVLVAGAAYSVSHLADEPSGGAVASGARKPGPTPSAGPTPADPTASAPESTRAAAASRDRQGAPPPSASAPPGSAAEAGDPSAEPEATPRTPMPTPTPTPTPEPPMLAAGDAGPKVRALQSRLDQIAWYEPDITGDYDDVTVAAVSGFQAKRGLQATGELDRRTWGRLLDMTRRPTHNEMHNILTPGPTLLGPEDTGRRVRELQARLAQIGWFYEDVTDYYGEVTTAAVAGFQTKREIPSTGEVDARTWQRLLAMTTEPTGAELFDREPKAPAEPAPAALDPRCLTGEVLCIDKSSSSLRWVVDGSVQETFDVRFGAELTPTREGQFAVTFKSRDHVSSLFDTPMPFAMFFSGGQAVHYSPDFAANGYNGASHGCVNVRDYDAIAALFDQVDVGDRVVVYWS